MLYRERMICIFAGISFILVVLLIYLYTKRITGSLLTLIILGGGLLLRGLIVRDVLKQNIINAKLLISNIDGDIVGIKAILEQSDLEVVKCFSSKKIRFGVTSEFKFSGRAIAVYTNNKKIVFYFNSNDNDLRIVRVGKFFFSIELEKYEVQQILDMLQKYE